MKIIVHRGAHQIGGNIVEISTANSKVIFDLGKNLPGSEAKDLTKTDVDAITADTDAIFYSHYHGDHVGLFHLVDKHIPQYIGNGAKDVMICKHKALKDKGIAKCAKRLRTYEAGKKYDIKGEIFITPYFVSHSAFDAYMFKIECEGKTILYTGDFRSHGYLGKGLIPTLTKYIGKVDILISEGTMLGRKQEKVITESDILANTIKFITENKYTFALCSSTDIDRLASFQEACKITGRQFVTDKYQEDVLNIFTKYSGKKRDLFRFSPFVLKHRDHCTANKVQKLFKWKGFLMIVRTSREKWVKDMLKVYNDSPAWLIYSMWNGYTEQDKPYTNNNIIDFREMFGSQIKDGSKDGFHTSGHADIETLKAVCDTVQPRLGIISIHKDKDAEFASISGIDAYHIFDDGKTTIENIDIDIR